MKTLALQIAVVVGTICALLTISSVDSSSRNNRAPISYPGENFRAETLADLKQLCQCVEAFGPAEPSLDPSLLPVDVSLENNTKCKYATACPSPDGCCQPCFDCYGWQLFIALNWPAAIKAGDPDPSKSFGDPRDYSAVVWQSYKDAFEVFGATPPRPWGTNGPLELILNNAVNPSLFLKADLQADHNWLTDQDRQMVRYDIRINRDEFEYIVKNNVWNKEGLRKAVTTGPGIDLPSKASEFGAVGAIEVKAAWRLIPEARREYFEQNYKVAHAKVYDAATSSWMDRDVALVGLHIVKKTPNSPQWVWVTFEHRDNAPVEGDSGVGKPWNFFDPAAAASYTPSYKSPPDARGSSPTPKDRPVQVIRVKQSQDDGDAARINDAMHQMIEARFPTSVWRNYNLISVQWPRDPLNPAPNPKLQKVLPAGQPRPRVLANMTMETYAQLLNSGGGSGVGPGSSRDQGPDVGGVAADKGKSSCIGCHRISAVTPFFDPTTRKRWPTDYSTLFYKAIGP